MMLAKYLKLLGLALPIITAAQAGNVGIDTATPNARLEIQSQGNTASTAALRATAPGGAQIFNLPDNGYVTINQPAGTAPAGVVDLLGVNGNDIYIQNPGNAANNFLHMTYAGGGSYNNANFGGQLFLFDNGDNSINNIVSRGILIAPANAAATSGLYLASDGTVGFSTSGLPTTDLDVGGSIRVRETAEAIVAGTTCISGRAGEINYYKGHFYGCNGTWKQLDN